jgi:curved DNA-binding protein CbpA
MADVDLEGNDLTRLIEALACGDPIPDASAIGTERKELVVLLAEITKGERSQFLPQITRVAQRREISPQEIAARAGFLLACFNAASSDDYYQILGVPTTAAPQEIRDAWIRHISIYHPDRHPAKGDWFTRQAARLNEAYQTLKDPVRRQEYDDRRRAKLTQQQRDPSLRRYASQPARMSLFFGGQIRRWLPKIITGASVIAAALMMVSLFRARPARQSDATLLYLPKTAGFAMEALPRSRPAALEQKAARSLGSEAVREEVNGRPSREEPAPLVPRAVQKVSEPSRKRALVAQALPPLIPEPKGLDRKEIDALLDEYVDAYEKGDLERFMATFSPRVREKETLDYQGIRSLYAKGFAGREQIIYRIKNVRVEIKDDSATVSADYLISAKGTGQSQRSVNASGRIEWKIQREGIKPKIIAINY